MKTELEDIQFTLYNILSSHMPPLKVRSDTPLPFEVAGTKEALQGRKKVDGFYFASVLPKPSDVRLYFFPIYTHPKCFGHLSDELRSCLKGKSCFHFKLLDPDLEQEIRDMVATGIELYEKDDLI